MNAERCLLAGEALGMFPFLSKIQYDSNQRFQVWDTRHSVVLHDMLRKDQSSAIPVCMKYFLDNRTELSSS